MARPAKNPELKAQDEKLPIDEINKLSSNCPWCSYDNEDDEKGPIHEKVTGGYFVRNVGHKYQCDSCGKFWKKSDLGKPWTIELERGGDWARESRIKELKGV